MSICLTLLPINLQYLCTSSTTNSYLLYVTLPLILLGCYIVTSPDYPVKWPKARTNYETFNIRFQGANVWDNIYATNVCMVCLPFSSSYGYSGNPVIFYILLIYLVFFCPDQMRYACTVLLSVFLYFTVKLQTHNFAFL